MLRAILSVFLLVTTLGADAFGEGVVGNGGDIVYCATGPVRAELLDIYEARRWQGLPIKNWPGVTYKDKLRAISSSLGARMPWKADQYLADALRFEQEAHMVSGQELEDIPDSEHIALPRDCVIRQIVIQRKASQFVTRYLVNGDLWALLDENNKAALVMHEVIYKEALSLGAKNSLGVRDFNAKILSETLCNLSDTELYDYLPGVAGLNSTYESNFLHGWLKIPYENAKPHSGFRLNYDSNERLLSAESVGKGAVVRTKLGDFPFDEDIHFLPTGFAIKLQYGGDVEGVNLQGSGATMIQIGNRVKYIDETLCGQPTPFNTDPNCGFPIYSVSVGSYSVIYAGTLQFDTIFGRQVLDRNTKNLALDQYENEISWLHPTGLLEIPVSLFAGTITSYPDERRYLTYFKNGQVAEAMGDRFDLNLKNGNLVGKINEDSHFRIVANTFDFRQGKETNIKLTEGVLSLQGNRISLNKEDITLFANGSWAFSTRQSFYLTDAQGNQWFVPGGQERTRVFMDNNDKITKFMSYPADEE